MRVYDFVAYYAGPPEPRCIVLLVCLMGTLYCDVKDKHFSIYSHTYWKIHNGNASENESLRETMTINNGYFCRSFPQATTFFTRHINASYIMNAASRGIEYSVVRTGLLSGSGTERNASSGERIVRHHHCTLSLSRSAHRGRVSNQPPRIHHTHYTCEMYARRKYKYSVFSLIQNTRTLWWF